MNDDYNEAVRKIPMPKRILTLNVSDKGYPVPWFVAWLWDGRRVNPGQGQPDFRVVDTPKIAIAVNQGKCWVCGGMLGQHLAFPIGPMCCINRVTAEPPSHLDCAEFSARACPFLTNPRMRRNEKDLPETRIDPPGEHNNRNPGAICIWVTKSYKPFEVGLPTKEGQRSYLFKLGPAERLFWYAEGRKATKPEIIKALESGYPILREAAKRDGTEAMTVLEKMIFDAQCTVEAQWVREFQEAQRESV